MRLQNQNNFREAVRLLGGDIRPLGIPDAYQDVGYHLLVADVPVALTNVGTLMNKLQGEALQSYVRWAGRVNGAALAMMVAYILVPWQLFVPANSPVHQAILAVILLLIVSMLIQNAGIKKRGSLNWALDWVGDLDELKPGLRSVAAAAKDALRPVPYVSLAVRQLTRSGQLTHLLLTASNGPADEVCLGAWRVTGDKLVRIELPMLTREDLAATTAMAARLGAKSVRLASLRSAEEQKVRCETLATMWRQGRVSTGLTVIMAVAAGTFFALILTHLPVLVQDIGTRVVLAGLVTAMFCLRRWGSRPWQWPSGTPEGVPVPGGMDLIAIASVLVGGEALVVETLDVSPRVSSAMVYYVQQGARRWPLRAADEEGHELLLAPAAASGL